MTKLPLAILCDKDDGRKKCEGFSFPKLVVKYCDKNKELDVTWIGISLTGNDSISAAESIHHSLQMYDAEDKLVSFACQGTDAGGGGTREDLGQKLTEKGRVQNVSKYNVTTCTLHALNLILSSSVLLTLGAGGLKERTALQLLHSCYNLSQSYRTSEWQSV